MPKKRNKEFKKWNILDIIKTTGRIISALASGIFTLLSIIIFIGFISIFLTNTPLQTGNIAIIPITGTITGTPSTDILTGETAVSDSIIKSIKTADKDNSIKAILLDINSPGGSPVATYEIAQAIKTAKKPTTAVIREAGASGGYWIATAAQEIWANPLSITGSIGVRASRLEFAGLIKDYNITYRRLIAGEYKDAGSPWKEMTPKEEQLYQEVIDKLHEQFINAVAENRKLPKEKITQLANGFIYLGIEAKENGLIDHLGSKEDAIKALEKKLNITAETKIYKEKKTILDMFATISSQHFTAIGKGIAAQLTSQTTHPLI